MILMYINTKFKEQKRKNHVTANMCVKVNVEIYMYAFVSLVVNLMCRTYKIYNKSIHEEDTQCAHYSLEKPERYRMANY